MITRVNSPEYRNGHFQKKRLNHILVEFEKILDFTLANFFWFPLKKW